MDHHVRALTLRTTLASLLLLTATGCLAFGKQQGVKNTWRAVGLELVEGVTTQAEVAQQVGPPSQILGLEGQTIFYYVRERSTGRGLILLAYNHVKQNVDYDRAVFFFDAEGKLSSFSFSEEEFPVEDDD